MATWRELISLEMKERSEDWFNVEACTLSASELDLEFDNGYGGSEGMPFTLWTQNRVCFPVVYDGSEWCDSVPRNPCSEKSRHSGGE